MKFTDILEADQVKAKEKKPKKIKPNMGHESPHPYRGRLVGESTKKNHMVLEKKLDWKTM